MNKTDILKKLIFYNIIIASTITFLIALSVKDTDFIVKHKLSYILELIFVCILPSFILAYVFYKTRNISIKDSLHLGLFFSLKLVVFHILFQLAGIYDILTPRGRKAP